MNIVSKSSLRITIYNIINEAIAVHRESEQNEIYNEYYPVITKTEVIDFIESNPYFDAMLKEFLKDKFVEDVDAIVVSEEWKEEFVKKVYKWAGRWEWLYCMQD
ncbi:hypothetical protein MEO42_27480 [Dolichospermum sp. ST_sed6]|nr:hypothetical protein [Dolichospermum sp. ST_sed6]